MTFKEELILSIINNIGIGAVVGLAAFLLNVILEKYKTSQAMRAEAAKVRVQKIAPIWEGIQRLHAKLDSIREITYKIQIEERTKLKDSEKTNLDTQDEIPPLALKKIEEKVLPEFDDIFKQINDLHNTVIINWFWLGKKLTKVHKQQINALKELATLMKEDIFKRNPIESLSKYFEIGRVLRPSKLDISNVLKYL